jgi:transposase
VLSFPPSVRIYLATGPTDMRNSFDGLAGAAKSVLGQDPMSGHVFVFCNRRRDLLKLLFWDRSGFVVVGKRLEEGTFAWPEDASRPSTEATVRDLLCVLEGIDLRDARLRKRMDRVPARA